MAGPAPSDNMLFFAHAMLPEGWAADVLVTIEDGLIRSVAPGSSVVGGAERHAVALPGLPNLHSHAFQRGMAGLAETRGPGDDSFWTWREIMYRFVDRMTPEQVRDIAAMAYVEMLESGFTRVGEFHYLHHDRDGGRYDDPAEMSGAIVAAAQESGIALTLLPVFYAHSGFGGAPPGPGHRRFVNDLEDYAALRDAARGKLAALPDAVLGVAPHSLRAVTPEQLAALVGSVGEAPIHIHVAEQVREVEDCVAWSGARPVEWLLDNAPVDPRWCLVHATHVTDREVNGIAVRGAVVGLCPITEANLGDGLFPADTFVAAGGDYGVGSDSNVLIDATEELRLLEYGQRLQRRRRNVLATGAGRSTGDDIYRAALAGGARALGAPGGIAPGRPADMIGLRADHPALHGRSGAAIADALIFAAGRSGIDSVWRRGERLVSGGVHRARRAVEARYRSTLAALIA